MTAVTTKVVRIEGSAMEDLRTLADQAEKRLEKFTASLTDSRRRRENLIAERGSLVMPARVEKNSAAQKRLLVIDEQLVALNRDIKDDEAVLSDLARQVTSAQQNLERAEWEAQRAIIRERINRRFTGETAASIDRAVTALVASMQAAKDEDEAIRTAMVSFAPRLHRETRPLERADAQRADLATSKLSNLLPRHDSEFNYRYRDALAEIGFAGIERQAYGELLRSLDSLELVF